jgi:hypothetical protein
LRAGTLGIALQHGARNGGPTAGGVRAVARVTTLIERWTNCWHFRGEEPYNAAPAARDRSRRGEVVPGNDEERARLSVAWKDRADAVAALAKLDELR